MRKPVKLRTLTNEEVAEIRRLAASRTEPFRTVQRARLIAAMMDNPNLYASEAGNLVGYRSPITGVTWVKRFNEEGLAGLPDKKRGGRKPTHSQAVRSALISLALQKPNTLGYPFKLWTLERLQNAFEEREGVHLSDSTIWTWMAEEGFEWKRQESWFHEAEKHDPQFVEKRGVSSQPT
jgi:transposase